MSSVPVCGSTHFLLLVSARGRVSVSIVVKTVEGVVGVIKHSFTLRSQMWAPNSLAPLTVLATAQQQHPVLLLCFATMLCSASWHSLWALLMTATPPAPTSLPLLVPAALQERLQSLSSQDHLYLSSLNCGPGLLCTVIHILFFISLSLFQCLLFNYELLSNLIFDVDFLILRAHGWKIIQNFQTLTTLLTELLNTLLPWKSSKQEMLKCRAGVHQCIQTAQGYIK